MKRPFSRYSPYPALAGITAAVALLALLSYALLPILTPFAAALLLTYICYPAQKKLVSKGINPNIAAILVLSGLALLGLAFLLILLPLMFEQLQALYTALGKLFTLAQQHWLPLLQAKLGVNIQLDFAHFKDLLAQNSDTLRSAMTNILKNIGSSGMAVAQVFTNIVLTPVVFFYFLRDANDIAPRAMQLAPRRHAHALARLITEIDLVLGEFLRGQITVMIIMSGFYIIGLSVIGLDSALPIGLLTGMLTFIPFVGATLGLLLGSFAAFTQYGDLMGIWPTLAVFLIGQTLESNFITPKLVGDRIGLHPVAVIFSLMAFGQLFGFIGVLLALPSAAVLYVCIKRLISFYQSSRLYRKTAPTPPRSNKDAP